MPPDVPRDPASPAAAHVRARREAHAARLAELRAARWRVGVVGGRWRLAHKAPDGPWRLLEESLAEFADIDPAAERKRVVAWTREVIGPHTAFWWPDRAAAAQGRAVWDIEFTG